MRTITLEELLEAGCHFGHQVTRQNPKARDYIFEARDGIHIIDLEKTKEGLEEAAQFVKELGKKNATLLLLGTKRQAEGVLEEEVARANTAGADGLYYVTKRWIGGTLTNLPEVSKNFRKLKDLKQKLQDPSEKAKYTKREIGEWEKERQKLESFYSGIVDMAKLPDALIIIDTHLEHLAVREALNMGVKTVGIVDTNTDPGLIDYPVPANDDAVGSIKLVMSYLIDAWIEGKKNAAEKQEAENKKQAVEAESAGEKKAAKAKESTGKSTSGKSTEKPAEKETKKVATNKKSV
jgi:small subunit ribosomal protein S2